MRFVLILALSVLAVLSFGVKTSVAERPNEVREPVLVELFSSQNCAACPKANENLIELANEREIFPIVWSVPYWDYLGWDDTHASSAFADRQKAYADRFNLRGPYTPQAVIDGCLQTTGLSARKLRRKVDQVQMSDGNGISLTVSSDEVIVTADAQVGELDAWLVGYTPGVTRVTPSSGGNAGSEMAHAHMATDLAFLGEVGPGMTRFSVSCPATACLVIVQGANGGDVQTFKTLPGVSDT